MAQQTRAFLDACLLGAALGLFYDVFRITRVAFPREKLAFGWVLLFFEDILFFFISAAVTFVFLMREIDGRLRFFLIIGEFVGAVLYYYTIGALIMRIAHALIDAVWTAILFVEDRIIRPLWNLCYRTTGIICRPLRFLIKFLAEMGIKGLLHLKSVCAILYNQLQVGMAKIWKAGKTERVRRWASGRRKRDAGIS